MAMYDSKCNARTVINIYSHLYLEINNNLFMALLILVITILYNMVSNRQSINM